MRKPTVYAGLFLAVAAFVSLAAFQSFLTRATSHEPRAMTSSIGDRVWEDQNGNGLQDNNEPGLDNIEIELYQCNNLDVPLQITLSANGGQYSFNGLPSGNYAVRFGSRFGYNFSPRNQGDNDQVDSDPGPDGFTACISLPANTADTTIDAGYTLCDPDATLVCIASEEVALGPACSFTVTPDFVLTGSNYCWAGIEVELFWNGISIGNTITADQVGDIVEALVTNTFNGNTCNTTLSVVDNLPPQVLQCQDVTVACGSSTEPQHVGGVNAADNCSPVFSSHADSIIPGSCADPFVEMIARSWVFEDESSNVATCLQRIYQDRPDVSAVVFPPDYDGTDEPPLDCVAPLTDPVQTGWPAINGIPLDSGEICGLKAFYSDSFNPGNCQGRRSILRSWTVRNSCTGEVQRQDQVIEINDQQAPVISCPANKTVSTHSNSCTGDILFAPATFSDNCSDPDHVTISIQTPYGNIQGNGGWLFGVPAGTFTATYQAKDDCGNTGSCSIQVKVLDNSPPLAICETSNTISLTTDGTGTICWNSVDNGSNDNCQVVARKLKRGDHPGHIPFTDCIEFSCADIGDTIPVRLRVYDRTGNFAENDPQAQYNECSGVVLVEDRAGPLLDCPGDITLQCLEDFLHIPQLTQDPSLGVPTYRDSVLIGYYQGTVDNCNIMDLHVLETGDPTTCGLANVRRLWRARDVFGNTSSCFQNIYIVNDYDFDITDEDCTNQDPADGIIWPCDYEASGCIDGTVSPDIAGRPILTDDFCNLVVVTFQDFEFPNPDSLGCRVIERTWEVADRCRPDSTFPNDFKLWVYPQLIRITSSDPPQIMQCEDITVCSTPGNCQLAQVALTLDVEDDCTPFNKMQFKYSVDLHDNGIIDMEGSDLGAGGILPFGVHRIFWEATDLCGNSAFCNYLFTVQDCTPPTPVCRDQIISLDPQTGWREVHAFDFNRLSRDDCTEDTDLQFSFSQDTRDTTRLLHCGMLLQSDTVPLTLWVTDEAGNQKSCVVVAELTDPSHICDQPVSISGFIANDLDLPIPEVEIYLDSASAGPLFQTMTGQDGQFMTSGLRGIDYTLTCARPTDYLQGVTTLDLILITQHILGINSLTNPYRIIAADANNDGKVTTLDIIEFRRLILHYIDKLPNVPSWRFIDKDYIFPNPKDPFVPPFPEFISFLPLLQEEPATDFVGLKVGDVDGSALNPDLLAQGRAASLTLGEPAAQASSGEIVRLAMALPPLESVCGFQFELTYDPEALELVNVENNNSWFAPAEHMQCNEPGRCFVSWHGTPLAGSIKLPVFVFRLKKDGDWRQWISLGSALPAQVYQLESPKQIATLALKLEPEDKLGVTDLRLFQNQPNPFNELTLISFYLPVEGRVRLNVFSPQGEVIFSREDFYVSGMQMISLERSSLDASGLLFYQLETPSGLTPIRKMVLLD